MFCGNEDVRLARDTRDISNWFSSSYCACPPATDKDISYPVGTTPFLVGIISAVPCRTWREPPHLLYNAGGYRATAPILPCSKPASGSRIVQLVPFCLPCGLCICHQELDDNLSYPFARCQVQRRRLCTIPHCHSAAIAHQQATDNGSVSSPAAMCRGVMPSRLRTRQLARRASRISITPSEPTAAAQCSGVLPCSSCILIRVFSSACEFQAALLTHESSCNLGSPTSDEGAE